MINVGDVVRLGPKARERHFVLAVFVDGSVRVRQCSTGKTRDVRADRCVIYSRAETRLS